MATLVEKSVPSSAGCHIDILVRVLFSVTLVKAIYIYIIHKMGILEKISEIEKEIARTQKNKGLSRVLYHRIGKGYNVPIFVYSYRIPFGFAES